MCSKGSDEGSDVDFTNQNRRRWMMIHSMKGLIWVISFVSEAGFKVLLHTLRSIFAYELLLLLEPVYYLLLAKLL